MNSVQNANKNRDTNLGQGVLGHTYRDTNLGQGVLGHTFKIMLPLIFLCQLISRHINFFLTLP